MLARLHGVPVVSVVLPGDRGDAPHRAGFGLSSELVSFWPPSARGMVRGLAPADAARLRCLGALSRFGADELSGGRSDDGVRRVVVLNGSGGGGPSAEALERARASAPGWEWQVLGGPRGRGWTTRRRRCATPTWSSPTRARTPSRRSPRPAGRRWWSRRTDRTTSSAPPPGCSTGAAGRWSCTSMARRRLGGAPRPGRAARRRAVGLVVRRPRRAPLRRGRARRGGRLGGVTVAVVTIGRTAGAPTCGPSTPASRAGGCARPLRRDGDGGPLGGGLAPGRPPTPEVIEVPVQAGMLPLAAARNAARRGRWRAGADVLVFLDVDCLAGPSLVQAYADAARDRPDVLWSGPVTYLPPPGEHGYPLDGLDALDAPHPSRPARLPGSAASGAIPTCSGRCPSPCTPTGGGAPAGSARATSATAPRTPTSPPRPPGRSHDGVARAARAYHQHHPTSSPPVQHLADILHNGALFRRRWGRWPMEGWLSSSSGWGSSSVRTASGG